VFVVAGVFVAVELAVSARYGIHRDELYFLACARHLSWGFVDQPPFVPAMAWLVTHLVGTSAVSLRILPALAGGGAVVLTALMARELGGGRTAQVIAAIAAATSPQVLATFHTLSTAAFDQFFWAAICFTVLRLLRTNDRRLWLAVGVLTGVGLMNKLSVAFLIFGLTVGLVIGRQTRALRSSWFWGGAAIAVAIWMPNLIWNAEHQWAALQMMRSLHEENSGIGASLGFVPSQLIVVGPVLVVLWLAGLKRLLSLRFARPFGIAYLSLVVAYTLTGGKSYYLAGMYFVLFAAGGVWVEQRLVERVPDAGLRGWLALMFAGAVVAVPLALPVLPESALARGSWEANINKDLSATVGWPQLVRQIASVAERLPSEQRANLVILTGDYGAAGAVDLYGASYDLPHAISGHNNYWWWGPGQARHGATSIAVNLPRSFLLTIFSEVSPAGTVATPGGAWSEERGDPIWVCRGQKVSWAAAWPQTRHYG
jgi:4-amino-4-deoxy-L-arabinose transferase-like glycosyltransferase